MDRVLSLISQLREGRNEGRNEERKDLFLFFPVHRIKPSHMPHFKKGSLFLYFSTQGCTQVLGVPSQSPATELRSQACLPGFLPCGLSWPQTQFSMLSFHSTRITGMHHQQQ